MWLSIPDGDIVTRRVNRRPDSIDRVLAGPQDVFRAPMTLGTAGVLRVDRPFTRRDGGLVTAWRTEGRLYGSGLRLARYARVELELSVFSTACCEVRLRPVCRHAHRWGGRRQRGYFDLAHRAADSVVAVVAASVKE